MGFSYIGIDNGVSGSVGIITYCSDLRIEAKLFKMPIFKSLDYIKQERYLNRIDILELKGILKDYNSSNCFVAIERPMVNPMRFRASVSALRALEAVLIAIEQLQLPFRYIDSKEWQKELFGKSKIKDLKKMSLEIAKRLFPQVEYKGFLDADGLLIAEYLRRKFDDIYKNK